MLIKLIRERLEDHPQISYSEKPGFLEVPPQSPNGFSVWVEDRGSRFTVGYEGWHEEFDDPAEALDCFLFGLSSLCRLRVLSRGYRDYKWQLLRKVGDEWVVDSEMGLLIFPFSGRRRERELCNRIDFR